VTDELEVLRKLDKALHTIRYDGMRLLVLLYFLNQQFKWVDSYLLAELGLMTTGFYTASIRLEKLGLVERRRLDIKSFVRITEKGRRFVECLLFLLEDQSRGDQKDSATL
jgi:DNA-binding MarR family transcriptional regulator